MVSGLPIAGLFSCVFSCQHAVAMLRRQEVKEDGGVICYGRALEKSPIDIRILKEEVIVPLGILQSWLAHALNIAQRGLSSSVCRKLGISPGTLVRFAEYFGTSPRFWPSRQAEV